MRSRSENTPRATSLVIVFPQLIWQRGERRGAQVWEKWRIPKLYTLLFLRCIYMRIFYRHVAGLQVCGPPRTIKNGDFILSSTSGKPVARYSCYHGFKLKGAAAIVCEGNRWSDQPPRCAGMTLFFWGFFSLPPTCFTAFGVFGEQMMFVWVDDEGGRDSYIKHPQYLNRRLWKQTQMIPSRMCSQTVGRLPQIWLSTDVSGALLLPAGAAGKKWDHPAGSEKREERLFKSGSQYRKTWHPSYHVDGNL